MNKEFLFSQEGKEYIAKTPPCRLGEYHELEGPLLLLASDASSFITGTVTPVDDGHSVRLV